MSDNEPQEPNTPLPGSQPSKSKISSESGIQKSQAELVESSATKSTTNMLKNALKMAFGTMTSRVLGLLRESLLAALFDKSVTDAFNAAFKIPNLFRRLLGEGSLSVSFIPVFVDAKAESPERAQNLVNSFYTMLLVLLGILTALGVFFSDDILRLILSPEYVAQTEKMQLTSHLAKIMFLFIFFISSFAFIMGILNSLGEFFWPAIAPTFWNLAMVVSTVWPKSFLPEKFAEGGYQLAWGVVFGGVLQVGVLIPALMKSGYLPRPKFSKALFFKNPDSLRVFRNMVPGLIGMGLLQLNTVINLRFSSRFSEGTVSYINYVDRLIELPLSLISVSLGTALLPMLSDLWTQKKNSEFAEVTRRSLELNLYLSWFASIGLFVLALPIVDLLYGRGKFGPSDVQATAEILKSYAAIMIFSSGVRVLTPSYFAIKNTWLPALVSGICVTFHLFLAPVLMARYQVQGLMFSTIASAGLNFFLLLLLFPRFIGTFDYLKFSKSILIFFVAGILFFIVTMQYTYLQWLFEQGFGKGSIANTLSLFLMLAICFFSFMVISYLFRIHEVTSIMKKIRDRFRKKPI